MAVASQTAGRPASANRRAAIVAADEITCRRVAELLESAGFIVEIEASRIEDITRIVDAGSAPDAVVVVDAAQRHEAAQQVRALKAALPEESVIVVASADHRRGAIQGALGAGARALIPLSRLDEALAPSLGAALAGQMVMPVERKLQLHSHALTSREKQTLALVVMGLTNGEIAAKLFLAESTVKSHLSSTFNKLGVRSRNEAAAMILDPNSGIGPGILTIPTTRL